MTSNTGVLYVVATPIGNLADITERAKSVLSKVDLIAAEDTRHTGRLLQHLGLSKKLISLHQHNERQKAAVLVAKMMEGENIALVSDAGTPLISDPGYYFVREVLQAGIKIVPIPGPCAIVTALSVSGIATDRFIFEGFLPAKSSARRNHLLSLQYESRSLVFYESTHRIEECLSDMQAIFGGKRLATIARELTKVFETIFSGDFESIVRWMSADSDQRRGEFVIIVSGNHTGRSIDDIESDRIVDLIAAKLPLSQATALAAEITGAQKKELYQRAIQRKDNTLS